MTDKADKADKKGKHAAAREAVSGLILAVFRLNNALLRSGDRLVAPLGLTSARWQILGAIALGGRPQPVAWLARDLGANRQNVQRIINDLVEAGLAAFEPNPHHRRAHLVVLTDSGRKCFDAAMRLQGPWAEELAARISSKDIESAHRVVRALHDRLDREDEEG